MHSSGTNSRVGGGQVPVTRGRLHKRWRRVTRRVKKSVAIVAAAGVAVTGFALAAPASATSEGAGLVLYGDYGAWGFRGAQIQDGAAVFCLDWTSDAPIGSSPTSVYGATSLGANDSGNQHDVGGEELGRINYILSTWGNTGDGATAAAVDLAVASYLQNGGVDGMAKYVSQSAEGPGVLAQARSMVNEANGVTIGGSPTAGSGVLTFTVNPEDNFRGTVQMQDTAGSTGDITLTNGFFDDNGNGVQDAGESNVKSDAQANTAYTVYGLPPEGATTYKISGAGDWSTGGGTVWPAEVDILEFGGGMQRMARAIGPVQVQTGFQVSGSDPNTRSVVFAPVLSTTATTFVQAGQPFTDQLVFSTAAVDGLNNPWFRSATTGNYAPVKATGVVYGPFQSQPAESDTVPAGAPVAGEATITTSLTSGPTAPYTASTNTTAATSGFYTWVWKISAADQGAGTQRVIPEDYAWQDRFGQVVESSVVPMNITGVTQVKTDEVPLSGVAQDTATINSGGYWLQENAANVPVKITWKAYHDASEQTPARVPASEIPSTATLLGTYSTEITNVGNITTPASLADGGIQAPDAKGGWIVWVLSIDDQDQPRPGYVRPFSDDYGVPSEIQKITLPEVATKAQPGAKPGQTITDTATVTGTLPADGADLHFELYKATRNEAGEWVCEAGNLLWTSESQHVETTGDYVSPAAPGQAGGEYHWVEVLSSTKGNEIHRGLCGLPDETTFVVDVTTKAKTESGTASAKPGEAIFDTALLNGQVPEKGTLTFEAYRVFDGAKVCTDETRVWTSDPITLEGGLVKDLQVDSARFTPTLSSKASTVYFVETTRDATGRIVAQGECGEPSETIPVDAAKLAVTGGDSVLPSLVLVGGVGLLGVGSLTLLVAASIRRRRQAATARQ